MKYLTHLFISAWSVLEQVEINETGTTLKLKPGYVTGGRVTHDCGTTRSLGWFIEGLMPLALFRCVGNSSYGHDAARIECLPTFSSRRIALSTRAGPQVPLIK